MKTNVVATAVCAVALTSQISVAAPVEFDFTEYNRYTSDSLEFTGSDGESTVNVSAWSEYGQPLIGSSPIFGLSVFNCHSNRWGCGHDNSQIDGRGASEAAVIDFGEMVNLVSATFSLLGGNDTFTLLVDGDEIMSDVSASEGDRFRFFTEYSFDAGVSGSAFTFLADNRHDDFKLTGIAVDYISNVPEPATLSLLGLGLAGLGSLGRKKRG